MKQIVLSFFFALSGVCTLSQHTRAETLSTLSGLSEAAKNSLVAHYDGRHGVETAAESATVVSWIPVDGNGNPLEAMKVTSSGGDPGGITYNRSTATLNFDDTNKSTRSLTGTLANAAGSNFTVFWKGSYDPTAPHATSGTYAYNIGPNKISHQRDDASGGRWVVELFNGSNYAGDDITAYDDIPATVWSTIITANSHQAYANGTNLNVAGNPAYSLPANASIRIGAYDSSGYDLQGDISQMIVFQSSLNDEDRRTVENYLSRIAVGGPSVSSNKPSYVASEDIRVTFLYGPGNAGDKIAVLSRDAIPGKDKALFQIPTSGPSGAVTFSSTELPQGNYALWHLSENDGMIAGPAAIAIAPEPTLILDKKQYKSGEPIIATFAHGPGNSDDYIGIYPAHITPTSASGRATWQYANSAGGNVTEGNVTIPTSYIMPPGEYRAWFFPNYGYVPTANSTPFTVTSGNVPPAWQAEPIRLRHVVTGNPFTGFLSPYLSLKNNDGPHTFEKIDGPAWLTVAGDGALSGTPAATDAGKNTFTIRATSIITGLSSKVSFDIPVFLPGQESVPHLSVMSYNTWYQWGRISGGTRKGIESIARSGADIIGFQESSDNHSTNAANELGWHRATSGNGSVQLISRYPIVESHTAGRAIGARIRVSENPRRDVIVYTCHLDYRFYGPYLGPEATAEDLLRQDARSGRFSQVQTILADLSAQLANADNIPVFLVGDFNCPTHLDWTAETAHLHHGVGPVVWPTSNAVINAGMLDSYRIAHPDPLASYGETWSPIFKDPTPQDRIDFIYHKGSSLKVLSSQVFTTEVEATRPGPYSGNTWPSDHAAIISVFSIAQ